MTKPKSTGGPAIQEVARDVADKWRKLLDSKPGRAVIAAQEAAIAKFGEHRFANFFAAEMNRPPKRGAKSRKGRGFDLQGSAWLAVEMAIKDGHAPTAEKAAHYLEKEDGLKHWIVDGGKHPSAGTIRSLHSREANRRRRAKTAS